MTAVATDTGDRQVSEYLYIYDKKYLFSVFRDEVVIVCNFQRILSFILSFCSRKFLKKCNRRADDLLELTFRP